MNYLTLLLIATIGLGMVAFLYWNLHKLHHQVIEVQAAIRRLQEIWEEIDE